MTLFPLVYIHVQAALIPSALVHQREDISPVLHNLPINTRDSSTSYTHPSLPYLCSLAGCRIIILSHSNTLSYRNLAARGVRERSSLY